MDVGVVESQSDGWQSHAQLPLRFVGGAKADFEAVHRIRDGFRAAFVVGSPAAGCASRTRWCFVVFRAVFARGLPSDGWKSHAQLPHIFVGGAKADVEVVHRKSDGVSRGVCTWVTI